MLTPIKLHVEALEDRVASPLAKFECKRTPIRDRDQIRSALLFEKRCDEMSGQLGIVVNVARGVQARRGILDPRRGVPFMCKRRQ